MLANNIKYKLKIIMTLSWFAFCALNSNCFKVPEYIGALCTAMHSLNNLHIKADKPDLLCITC